MTYKLLILIVDEFSEYNYKRKLLGDFCRKIYREYGISNDAYIMIIFIKIAGESLEISKESDPSEKMIEKVGNKTGFRRYRAGKVYDDSKKKIEEWVNNALVHAIEDEKNTATEATTEAKEAVLEEKTALEAADVAADTETKATEEVTMAKETLRKAIETEAKFPSSAASKKVASATEKVTAAEAAAKVARDNATEATEHVVMTEAATKVKKDAATSSVELADKAEKAIASNTLIVVDAYESDLLAGILIPLKQKLGIDVKRHTTRFPKMGYLIIAILAIAILAAGATYANSVFEIFPPTRNATTDKPTPTPIESPTPIPMQSPTPTPSPTPNPTPEPDSTNVVTVTVNTQALNVRSGAGASNNIIGQVYFGNVLTVLEERAVTRNHIWFRIIFNDLEGWVYAPFTTPR
ncbi:MAG: SH3 domain-containing protein [Defluviitaleaceae bacterium]|nr:SH3 domain-containing protein [Defluviitaleaceae bacterium]